MECTGVLLVAVCAAVAVVMVVMVVMVEGSVRVIWEVVVLEVDHSNAAIPKW